MSSSSPRPSSAGALSTSLSETLTLLESQAEKFAEEGKYKEAETLYRQVLDKRTKVSGAEFAYRDMYNLSGVLVQQEKYQEAESFLSPLLEFLEAREGREGKREFIEQEAGTLRLLGRSLEGQGKDGASEFLRRAEEMDGTASKVA